MQMGFIQGTIDFILRQILEKYEMAGRKMCVVFVDLEETFDSVPKEGLVLKS